MKREMIKYRLSGPDLSELWINGHKIGKISLEKGIATIEDKTEGTVHSCHPNIEGSGSVAGMRSLGHWREEDKVVKMGGYKYNVSEIIERNIYGLICRLIEEGKLDVDFFRRIGEEREQVLNPYNNLLFRSKDDWAARIFEKGSKYFTVHSAKALESKNPSGLSWVLTNVENTPERLELARKQFPAPDWYIQFHDIKTLTNWVI